MRSRFDGVAQIARAARVDRWPVVGAPVRQAGRAFVDWLYRDTGVPATIDGQTTVRLSPRAFSGGVYKFDPKLTSALKELARPGREFLDVGAHVGIASLLYASYAGPDTRVVAFEPNPHVFPTLVENSRVNRMRIECFPLAVGATFGVAKFFTCGNNPNASLSGEAPALHWYWRDREKPAMTECQVQMTTIDRCCDELGMSPGLLKLDVEGAELQVLRGAARTLGRCRPQILMETHVFAWETFGYRREDLENEIKDLGYVICKQDGQRFGGPLGSGPEKDNNHFLLCPA